MSGNHVQNTANTATFANVDTVARSDASVDDATKPLVHVVAGGVISENTNENVCTPVNANHVDQLNVQNDVIGVKSESTNMAV